MTFISSSFEDLARLESATQDVPDLPILVVPHPFGTLPAARVHEQVDARWSDVLGSLTSGPTRRD